VTQVMSQAVRIFSKEGDNTIQIPLFPQGVLKKVSRNFCPHRCQILTDFQIFSPAHSKNNL